MTVIGIDTASRVGGVAVVRSGKLLASCVLGVEEGHSENLLPLLELGMERAGISPEDVEGLAVAIGPGSFTGLRIGVAAAKALAYAWDTPLRGVSTLLASAWPFAGVDGLVFAALDARRESVFGAMFDGRALAGPGLPEEARLEPEARIEVAQAVLEIQRQEAAGRPVYLVGDGAEAIARGVAAAHGEGSLPRRLPLDGEAARAASVAHIGAIELAAGRVDDPFVLVPNYLRRSEAERRWSKRERS